MRTDRSDDWRFFLDGEGTLFAALEAELRVHLAPVDVCLGLPDDARDRDVVVTTYDRPDPARDARVQRQVGRGPGSWLPVWTDHTEVWAGPWIRRGETACVVCVAARGRNPLSERDQVVVDPSDLPPAPRYVPAWLGRLLAGLVAGELARLRAGSVRLLRERALVWSLATLHAQVHPFSRLPGCAACGFAADDSAGQAERTFALLAAAPADRDGGRDGPPLARLTASLLSPRLGLVRGVARVDGPLPTAIAEMVVDRSTRTHSVLSGGRATSFDLAERVALFEALERHAGLAPGSRRPVLRASYRDLDGRALDPRTLILHSPEQYQAPGFPYQPFDEAGDLAWVWGYSFRERRPIAVPACAVYYGRWQALQPGAAADAALAYETSNGCALSTTMVEAVARGLLEVIERDGFLLAWYTRSARAALDLSSARDWRLVFLARRLERAGYRTLAWDVTQELGVPVVWVMAVSDAGPQPRTFSSCGCHFDPEAAAWSGLVEVAAGLRDLSDRYGREQERALAMLADSDEVRAMSDHSLLYAAPEAEERLAFLLHDQRDHVSFQDQFAPWQTSGSGWQGRLALLLDAVLGAGLDVIAVDQTTPEQAALGLVAVRTLVPGALPMTFGHGARRLEGAVRLDRRLEGAGAPAGAANPWPHPFP